MNTPKDICQQTINKLCAKNKGILAADESLTTMNKRLAEIGLNSDETTRRQYRELLIDCPNIEQYLNGIILHEETLYQSSDSEKRFCDILTDKGLCIGIKVDQGLSDLPHSSEKITRGLDSLESRLADYFKQGARFAKWRNVYKIDKNTPSHHLIGLNSQTLAHYAKMCLNQGIVPIIEPEILIDGDHSIEITKVVTKSILSSLFDACVSFNIDLSQTILKPSMITSGKQSSEWPNPPSDVSAATLDIFKQVVPNHVASINFLSGGQSPQQASDNLFAIQSQADLPWNVSFSFARAIQQPCMKLWAGESQYVDEARQELINRLKDNCRL